jgi:hypothetical protein
MDKIFIKSGKSIHSQNSVRIYYKRQKQRRSTEEKMDRSKPINIARLNRLYHVNSDYCIIVLD